MTSSTRKEARWLCGRRDLLLIACFIASSPGDVVAADAGDAVALRRAIVPSVLPRDGAVRFPNAGSSTVFFRAAPEEHYPPTPWQDFPALLRSAQQGDAASAGVVGSLLVRCAVLRDVPYSVENVNSLRRRPQVPAEGPEAAPLREFCAQRTQPELSAAMKWLQQGAGGGDMVALKTLARLYRVGSKEHIDVLNTIWQQGSVTALHKLAVAYGFRSAGPDSQPGDATKALASAWLHTQLNESAFRQHATQSDFVHALDKDLASRLERASPAVQREAIELAKAMLAENKNCCFVP